MQAGLFRELQSDELDVAHGILIEAADWLLSRGIRQWTTSYPKDLYLQSQERGCNYALEWDGEVAVIVTLSQESSAAWATQLGSKGVWWLSKLATAPAFRGKGLGRLAMQHAIEMVSDQRGDRIYLDCVYGTGFLVDFYRGFGFEAIDRRQIEFSTGLFDMVLMELRLQPDLRFSGPQLRASDDGLSSR